MSSQENSSASAMKALLEWSASYSKAFSEAGGGDLESIQLIEDAWDTRFLFLATHFYLFIKLGAIDSSSQTAGRFILPLYTNLVMNTRNMLIQFGVEKKLATSFVPNFYVRQYDYLIYLIGGLHGYSDEDRDSSLHASWYATCAKDLINSSEYLETVPESLEDFVRRGNARRESKDYEGAISDYTNALRIEPNDSEAYTYRGISYELLEDYEAANKDYSSAIEINPGNTAALKFRAFNKLTMFEDKNGAIEDYSKAIEEDPTDCDAYNRRAGAYAPISDIEQCSLEDLTHAIEDYCRAKEIDERGVAEFGLWKTYELRADLYLKDREYQKAIEDYSKAIEINDTRVLLTKRGNAKRAAGDSEGACRDWKKVLQVERTKFDTDEKVKDETSEAVEALSKFCNERQS